MGAESPAQDGSPMAAQRDDSIPATSARGRIFTQVAMAADVGGVLPYEDTDVSRVGPPNLGWPHAN